MYQLPPITIDEILLYLRKSRTDDPRLTVAEVLARHEQMLDEWVEKNLPGQGPVPESNRHREVGSGETIDSRPEMLKVLSRVESPRIKAILIVEPQRLSRGDLEDIGRLVKLLRYSNTIVITLQYIYDLRDERDRDLFERELKRGNEFLEYQKRIMGNGRLLSVENGNFIGQHAPYGYKKVVIKEDKKKCHTLEPIPEEAAVVKMVFDLYLKGHGAQRISDRLRELGVKPPKGERWAGTTIRTMLGNEHYIGKVRWFRKKTVKTVEGGEIVTRRPVAEDYLVYPGKHPAIIDEDVFEAVQKKRGQLPKTKQGKTLKNPLAGIARCSCGKSLYFHEYLRNGKPRAAARFTCRELKHCGNASCLASELLDMVKMELSRAIDDFKTTVATGKDDSVELHRQLVADLEKRLIELEALELSQWEKYTLDGMPKHIFEKLNAKTLAEKEEVQQALCTTKNSIPEPVNLEERIGTFQEALDMMNDPDAPLAELNELLKDCFESITYSRPKKKENHGRWATDNPIELVIRLRV